MKHLLFDRLQLNWGRTEAGTRYWSIWVGPFFVRRYYWKDEK